MDSHLKSATKSVIWRIMGVIILAAVTYAYTRSWIQTGLISILTHLTFIFVFYFHERVWLRFKKPLGIWRKILKMFTYETILGNLGVGLITYLVTGSLKDMAIITITYISIKHIVYIINEFMWEEE